MGFVVEDGTGKSDANSYSTVEFADSYFTDRGNTAWSGTDDQKKAWLIQATDYIEARFGTRFLGEKEFTEDPEQALAFPRINIPGQAQSMPLNLLKACAEYALRAKSAALAPDPSTDESGYAIQSTTKKVGPIEKSTTFATGVSRQLIKSYPAADMLLKGLVRAGGQVIRNG